MKFTRETPSALMIRKVTDGEIHIGGEIYRRTIALTAGQVVDAWNEKAVAELTVEDFAVLTATEPELIVLGTGRQGLFAPKEIMFAFARMGIGLEVMQTAAAARTFNVLASEGRKIAAVLYI